MLLGEGRAAEGIVAVLLAADLVAQLREIGNKALGEELRVGVAVVGLLLFLLHLLGALDRDGAGNALDKVVGDALGVLLGGYHVVIEPCRKGLPFVVGTLVGHSAGTQHHLLLVDDICYRIGEVLTGEERHQLVAGLSRHLLPGIAALLELLFHLAGDQFKCLFVFHINLPFGLVFPHYTIILSGLQVLSGKFRRKQKRERRLYRSLIAF